MKNILLILGLTISLFAYNYGTYEGNKKGCAEGNAKACNDLAGMYMSGEGHPERVIEDKTKAKFYYAKSKELYTKYCNEGDGKACFDIADIYNGMKWNVDHNYTMMLKHFTKSCENNYARGCSEVGGFYKRGRGTKKNKGKSELFYAKAVEEYEKECENGIASSCSRLSSIYGLKMYGTNNQKMALNLRKKTFQLYKDLCEKNDDEGCFQTAISYYTGNIVPVDWKKAKEYYARSCKYGQSSACRRGKDINVSKQLEYENKMLIQEFEFKYIVAEEKERKIREERTALQMKEINDLTKTMAERKARFEEIKIENILWEKQSRQRLKESKKHTENKIKEIESRKY